MTKMFKTAIITLSDRASNGEYEDKSGLVIKELLPKLYEVSEYLILPDDYAVLKSELIRLCDTEKCNLILTTGGTGFSPRDITPEATLSVAERNAPGISEAMRMNSMQYTKRAMLSRGVSVIRGKTLIVNLPGSPKAVKENLEFILDVLPHASELLTADKNTHPDG
jgi:molybdenum cofactor synthesis domain-containing protein